MKDRTHHLLQLKALLNASEELIERIADDLPPGDAERTVLAMAMHALATAGPRTRNDILRLVGAIEGGDEGWLVVHSIPGEHRIEAVYATKLSAASRRALGM